MAASSDFGRLGRPLFNSAREQVPRSLQLSPSMRHVSLSREDLVHALERTARGDRAAFEKVYAATAVKLYGIVIRILGRRDLAEDILQEVYIRVWQRASEFDPATGSPITWLATIARNRALDEARRKTMRSLDDCPELLQLSSDDDPLADSERNEEQRRLQACLDGLEAEKRQLVLRVYYYGMTREEIARATNRPVATVKTWLRRSLAQLKDCLSQ
jgi:RNA polymerase sigma-70 factor (ECF subfamily)